ncbi:tetratricopeptide repeat protein [Lysobacter claricitrinus]|uniref:tetratricopeptide repeat protein n=1 Tax=Lysobacter claricitrinus TaxID=3367728 RepID=UPI0038B35DE3
MTQVAQSRLVSGNAQGAVEAAEAALKADPNAIEAHSLLALGLDALGRSREAGPHHKRAAELAPDRGAFLNNYGIWLCSNGQAPASLDWFDRAAVAPGYETPDSALANAAACGLQAGQGARAERAARQALAIAPANPLALQTLARIELTAGRAMEARAFVERRLAAGPADPETLQLASQIEQSLGDTAAAARYGQRLRTEFPPDSRPVGEK